MAGAQANKQTAQAQLPNLQEKKSPVSFLVQAAKNLSLRERVLIWTLVIVALILALLLLLILPAQDRLAAARSEHAVLQSEESDTLRAIATLSTNKEIRENAQNQYDDYLQRYQASMLPEDLDRMLTMLIEDCGFAPSSLTLNPQLIEQVPPFTSVPTSWGLSRPEAREGSRVEEAQEDTTNTDGASSAANATENSPSSMTTPYDTGTSASGETSAATTDENTESRGADALGAVVSRENAATSTNETLGGGQVSVYNVNLIVLGYEENYYAFLDRVIPLTWIKVAKSSFTPLNSTNSESMQAYSIDLKIYVNTEATIKQL